MIKPLIKDLTYNNITLAEGLNRAKIIAFEIKNSEFKEWINFELNVLTPIKQEYYSKFRLLIMLLNFSLILGVYPGSIF